MLQNTLYYPRSEVLRNVKAATAKQKESLEIFPKIYRVFQQTFNS